MFFTDRPDFLRTVLLVDTATCIATGLLMTLGAKLVGELTHIPTGLLMSAGLSLFPTAALIAFVATRRTLWPAGIWLVVLGNFGWVAGSFLLLLGGTIAPNVLGITFVIAQAVAVAVLAELEFIGLRHKLALV